MIKSFKYIILHLLLFISAIASSQVFVDFQSQWSYFKGESNPSDPLLDWTTPEFNISSWQTGIAPFNYGYTEIGTQLNDMSGNFTVLYLRKDFQIDDFTEIDEIKLSVAYDDGFVLWINGNEIARENAPNSFVYRERATNSHNADELETYIFRLEDIQLNEGKNTIAIQAYNVSISSTDFYIDAKFEGYKILPKTYPATCDTPSGFFSNPFTVKLSTEQPGEIIKYTLDGSDPGYSNSAVEVTSPANVNIDPKSTEANRGLTGGVVLRASHIEDGYSPSQPITRNYLFLDIVKTQQEPEGNWPTFNVNGQIIDLEMDTSVTNNDHYKNLMESSLLDIPTIAISTDMDNLFGEEEGIYVNAKYHGYEWERPANIELINPNGDTSFNIDAGIRIRGGWSRHDNYPKHAFRVFFRSEYGEGKLNFPLFGNEGAEEFDKIDLRTSQNYSWANGGSASKYNTMNRDVFSRESQRDMDQLYTRSRYYHLYLNGLYWGVYQTQERADANFAESYLGGDDDDYDVIKVDMGENWNLYEIEATDGNTDAWEEVWNITQQGYASNLNYFKLAGQTPDGKDDLSLTKWVDIDNLIDYMLTIFYAGNFDAPVSKFFGNVDPNNFFAINDRTDKRKGFKFLIHDAEHSLLADTISPGVGLSENRVNIGTIERNPMVVSSFSKFHPQWLHFKLSESEEYRMKFADHVYRHFFNGGVFNPDSNIVRFKSTSDKLELAIIAESARWGDRNRTSTRTKIDDWTPAVNQVINEWMPYRTDTVINQLIEENLYPAIAPPVFLKDGKEIWDERITLTNLYTFSMENQNGEGSIVYTTTGEDPRKVGGSILESATVAGNTENIIAQSGTHIMARIKSGNTWSALHELVFEDSDLFKNLKVTELHYHPEDEGLIDGKDLEFIELKNIGNTTLDLSGLIFSEGIFFSFPEGSSIAPNSMIVLSPNMEVFSGFYGISADYEFSGNLSNSGEEIVLETATGQTVISFTFSDDAPWPEEADGDGYSLVSKQTNPTGNPGSPDYWTISKELNGSAFLDDANSTTGIPEIGYESAFDFSVYPNPSSNDVNLDFFLNSGKNIEISLYDLNGRLIYSLPAENLSSGYHTRSLQLSALNIKRGVYIVKFRTSTSSVAKKLIYQ